MNSMTRTSLSRPYIILGNIYIRKSEYDSARESFETALDIHPNHEIGTEGLRFILNESSREDFDKSANSILAWRKNRHKKYGNFTI